MAKNTVKATVAPAAVATAAKPINNATAVIAEVAQAWMEAFKDANNRDIELTEKVVISVIETAGKQWEAMDDDAKLALLLKAETTAKTVMIADPGISLLVKKMDSAFHAATAVYIDAVRKNKASAVGMLAQFRRIYTLAEMNSMPMPGWDEKNAEGTGYRPEKRSVKDQTGNPVTVNWGNDLASAMPEGKVAEDAMALVDKERKAPGTTALKGKSKDELNDIYESNKQDRNALRSLIRRSVKLHHRMIAVGKLNSVGIRFILGSKEKGITMPTKYALGSELGANFQQVTIGPKPLWIYNSDDPSKGRDFSVTQLLSMQPELAKLGDGGGNMADLIATAGKGPDDEDKAGTGDGSDMAEDVAQETASQFYNFINKRENMALVMKKIANRAKDADGNDWLDVLCSIHLATRQAYIKNKAAYEALNTKAEPETETEKEEVA